MADNLITTHITANADFTGLRTQLAATTAQLVKLQETTAGTNVKLANQIAVMNKSFAETMRSTGQFSTHFVSLTSDVEKFGKNLDSGRLKLGQYYNAWNGHTRKTSTLIRDLAKQQVMLQNAIVQPVGKNAQGLMQYNVMVAKGLDEVKNKTLIARQELSIMNKVMLDGSNQLINWGKNTQWAGRQLTVGLTVPLAAFGMAAQKAFRAADEELVRLTKVYGGLTAVSSAELAQVRKDVSETARELAGSYGLAFKDTIALAADLAATGQEGNDLLNATRETSRLAVLGEIDRQEAIKATLAIQNAFKQSTEELADSINFLNAVENQTSTTLEDLVEAIPKAGTVVKSLGGSVQDLALYLTAMKEGGVNATQGANAIKSAMASLINPTKVAKELFTGFGIDLENIVTSNAGNLTETILDLQSALDTLDPLSKSRAIEQLFGKFQYARLSALFENIGREGSQTVQVMELMGASTAELAGIAERELGMITESASGKFKRALASVQADLAGVGEQFLRISTKVLEVVDGIVKFFRGLPGPVKTFLNALGGLTAFAGPLIMLTGVMANFIGYVTKGIFTLRQMASGGKGFRLLTPEILAADAAAKGLSTTFYSDAEATVVLTNAVNTLAASFDSLEMKANSAKVAVRPGISTIAGSVIASGNPSGRIVDKNNPLIGQPYSRDMSHMIPAGSPQMGTIFGTVPGAGPVNVRIGKNPQSYMNQDLPRIPGVTSVNGISTGIVSQEAAKWHAMTAAIAMQSESELALLKKEVMATGTITSSLSDSYQALLPEFSDITELAAQETALIVKQLQQSKITADEARLKVIQLNATIEAMLAETAQKIAAGQGRVVNLTTVPLTSQPVVDPLTGKSNMKEMFHKGSTKEMADRIARALGGVRTSGAGYNIQTTKPAYQPNLPGLNEGGIVPGTGNTDTYYTAAEPGAFVINKKSTERNMPTISKLLGGTRTFRNTGGMVPVVLTPGEAVIPADIAKDNMPLMYDLNGGPGNTSGMGRETGGGIKFERSHVAEGTPSDLKKVRATKGYTDRNGKFVSYATTSSVGRGIPIWMTRDANQETRSVGRGMTGPELVKEFRKAIKAGRHPFEPWMTASDDLGGDPKNKAQFNKVFNEMLKKLEKDTRIFGGKNGDLTFEKWFQKEILPSKSFSSIRVGSRSFKSIFNSVLQPMGPRDGKQFAALQTLINGRNGLTTIEKSRLSGVAKGLLGTFSGMSYNSSRQNLARLMARVFLRRNEGGMVPGQFAQRLFGGDGFDIGGLVGNVLKGKAMRRIGAGFGPTGAPKPSMYESAPWGVNSLSIDMANKLFANTGLRKNTQKLFYDKFAAALAKEKPYGYVKDAQGSLRNALEPDALDSVIRSAASDMIGDRAVLSQLSPIDKDILRKKYLNWESKKDTPLTEALKKLIFEIKPREMGGPVNANKPYLVGEKGPEIFVPRNAGGIVPNTAIAIPPQGYVLGGGIVAMSAIPAGAAIGAQLISQKVANPIAQMIIQQVGFILPMIMMNSMMMNRMQSGAKTGGMMSKLPASLTTPIGMTSKLPGGAEGPANLTKYGKGLTAMSASGKTIPSMLAKIGFAATRLNIGLAVLTTALMIGKNRFDAYKESMRLNALGFGMTAEGAEKAGLKFTDYNKKIKDAISDAKALRETNRLIFESRANSGTALNITVEEFKKLKKEVKENFSDQISLINKTSADDQEDLAIRLKQQFIAMGMSAEEASKKIYALYAVSKFASSAAEYTVASEGFNSIKTSIDAAVGALRTYNDAVKNKLDPTEQANAFNTALIATQTAIAEAEDKAMKAREKEGAQGKKLKFISQSEREDINFAAEQQALDKITKTVGSQEQLGEELVEELKKQNPELDKLVNKYDTSLSVFQKLRIVARGFTGDLSKLNAEQTNAIYQLQSSISNAVANENRSGMLKKQYEQVDNLRKLQDKYERAARGQKASQQIADRDRIASLQKQIDKTNKLADARIRSLNAAKEEGDLARQIAKAQAAYQAALARGDTAGAQQFSLDIQGLQDQLQYNAQVKAIENARDAENAPRQKQIEAIQKKQQKLSDGAALAAEKLGDVSKAIDTQESAINKLNSTMTDYRLQLQIHKDDLSKFKDSPEAKALLTSIAAAAEAAKVDLKNLGIAKNAAGKYDATAGQQLFDKIAGGLEASLLRDGLIVNGDLIVNGKKIDIGGAKASKATEADLTKVAGKTTGGSGGVPKKYFDSAGNEVSEKAYKEMPVGAPGDGKEYTVPLLGMNSREFANRDSARREFFKLNGNKGQLESIDGFQFMADGSVRKNGKIVGSWLAALPGSARVKSYYEGSPGGVKGPGTSTSDSIPAYLSDGEYVVRAAAVKHYGVETFDAMNAKKLKDGGEVKQNWFQRYVSALTKSSDSSPAWARDPLGVQALLRKIAGQGRKGDGLNAALIPLNFIGIGQGARSGIVGAKTISNLTPEMKSFGMADIDAKAMQALSKMDLSSIKIPETGISFSPSAAKNALEGLKEGVTSSSTWEIIQAQRETLLKKKYPKIDFSDVTKFNEYYAKEFYDLLPDEAIKLFKGVRGTVGDAWRTGKKDLGTYFSTNPHIAALYSAMVGKAKLGEELPMFGIDKKISELKNFLGEGAIRNGSAQGSMEFPQVLGGDDLLKMLPSIYSLPGQVYGQMFGATATSLKHIKNLWPFGFAQGGYINPTYSANLSIPKFHDGINNVPADMLAQLQKNEAIIPANMNPFNPNANNATMGATYNITNNINGYDGDLNKLSRMVTQQTITAIKTLDNRTASSLGPQMNVGVSA